MRGRFATFALIAAVVLAGCTSTPGHPADPGSTAPAISGPVATPTTPAALSDPPDTSSAATSPPPALGTEVPADVPTTGPNLRHKGERPPVMPLLAAKHTPAGAVAFAKFFIQTIDWAYATTSTTYMRHYYEPTCVTCRSIQQGVDGDAAKAYHFSGDRIFITEAADPKASGNDSISVVVAFTVTAVAVLDSHGRFIDGSKALRLRNKITIRWSADSWHVIDVQALR